MRTALVIGITGGFGGHVASALRADGWRVKALMRDPGKLPSWQHEAEVIAGDARRIEDVRRAAGDADVIVYGVNVPYHRWRHEALALLEPSVQVAQERRLTLVFPGNVYVYDPDAGTVFDEEAPLRPATRKGEIRRRMEARLEEASRRGARILLIRAGDFIGAHARGSWIQVLTKATGDGYRLLRPGPADLVHTWANLPDVGRTVSHLLARRDQLPAFAPFHFEGYRVTFDELVEAVRAAGGKPVRVRRFPWWAVTLASPFVPFLRELGEMRYLWRRRVDLDGGRLRELLGAELPHTPLREALVAAGVVKRRDGGRAGRYPDR